MASAASISQTPVNFRYEDAAERKVAAGHIDFSCKVKSIWTPWIVSMKFTSGGSMRNSWDANDDAMGRIGCARHVGQGAQQKDWAVR